MITEKIKNLFQFIEFLHSNIDNFKQYDEVLNELYLLDKKRKQLSPRKNFKDKLKYDEVQTEIKDKFNVIQENILQPIQTKATDLNICDLEKTETLWNWNSTEIHQLKENFRKDDLPEIFKYKQQYIEYREKTKGEAFFGLGFFFDDLDELLKELFDYFKETDFNEFEVFETKAIPVNDIGEALKLMQLGHKKFTLPNSFLNPSTIQQQTNSEPLPPQQEKQNSKGGRPKAEYRPIETFIKEDPTYQSPKEIATMLKNQYSGGDAAKLKTMVEALKNLNIWKNAGDKEISLMLKNDFGLTTGHENYRKCKAPEQKVIDKEKSSIQRKITKT